MIVTKPVKRKKQKGEAKLPPLVYIMLKTSWILVLAFLLAGQSATIQNL